MHFIFLDAFPLRPLRWSHEIVRQRLHLYLCLDHLLVANNVQIALQLLVGFFKRKSTCILHTFVCYLVRSFAGGLFRVLTVLVYEPVLIEGVRVTALDANHCPGALLLLFELPDGRRILHTGDMRWDESMKQYSAFASGAIDELYLDTTFCDPR